MTTILDIWAENAQLRAEVRQLKYEKAAVDARLARFEKQVARLEAEIQGLKEALDAAQRQNSPRQSLAEAGLDRSGAWGRAQEEPISQGPISSAGGAAGR